MAEMDTSNSEYITRNVNSGDRFIPRRAGTDFEALNYMLFENCESSSPEQEHPSNECKKYANQAYLRWQRRMFKQRLLAITPMPRRILSFSSHTKASTGNVQCQVWPVRPRNKPLIGAPSTVLDMPNLEGNICHHVTDWGSRGYLATIFEGEVYLWHSETNRPYVVTNTGGRVDKCIRWNPAATHFAISFVEKGIAVYDIQKNKISSETVCNCANMCRITSLEWSKTNKLISGCSMGRLSIWSPDLKILKGRYPAHLGVIITICLSSGERYLATSGTDGHVRVWFWPGIEEHFEVVYCIPVRGVAFHPWKSLLAIGGGFGDGSLSIWNACNHEQLAYKPAANNGALSIDSLAWNPLTGELVVSYWQQKERTRSSLTEGKNVITVLSNLNTEVDAIEWHSGRVLYLLWGCDGTKLATAATDENLCMWDFLGNSAATIKKYKRSIERSKLTTDYMVTTSRFGYTIR